MKENTEPQLSRSVEPLKRRERCHAFHDVNPGYPQAVRRRLGPGQSFCEQLERSVRQVWCHQLYSTLQQQTARVSTGIPNDPSSERIRRFPVDSGSGERRAVKPGGMHIN